MLRTCTALIVLAFASQACSDDSGTTAAGMDLGPAAPGVTGPAAAAPPPMGPVQPALTSGAELPAAPPVAPAPVAPAPVAPAPVAPAPVATPQVPPPTPTAAAPADPATMLTPPPMPAPVAPGVTPPVTPPAVTPVAPMPDPMVNPPVAAPGSDELIGWATQGDGTTGGGDLAPVVVTSIEQLNAEAGGTDPKVIHIDGKLSGRLEVGSNKTIIGLTGAEIDHGAGPVRLEDSTNVIIKNLTLVGGHGDPNTVLHNAKNVWLDHIEFVDGKSDLLRLTGTTDFVTVSWALFRQTSFGKEHMGFNIGAKDSDVEGLGFMSVTVHHCLYTELVNERMPRARFGKVHTFNNVCLAGEDEKTKAYYAVRAGVDANVRSERNIYRDFIGASWWWHAEGMKNGEFSTAFSYVRDNENSRLESIEDDCQNCEIGPVRHNEKDGFADGKGGFYSDETAFVPPYPYEADLTADLEAIVMAGVGPK